MKVASQKVESQKHAKYKFMYNINPFIENIQNSKIRRDIEQTSKKDRMVRDCFIEYRVFFWMMKCLKTR